MIILKLAGMANSATTCKAGCDVKSYFSSADESTESKAQEIRTIFRLAMTNNVTATGPSGLACFIKHIYENVDAFTTGFMGNERQEKWDANIGRWFNNLDAPSKKDCSKLEEIINKSDIKIV